MKILSIETSSNICSVAILETEIRGQKSDIRVVKEISRDDYKSHSDALLPTIDKVLKDTNLTLDNIDLLAVSIGPGSFTGIRIGISTIKSFAIVKNIPVVGISSLLGLTYNIETDSIVCSLIDAKHDNIYCGIFDSSHNLLENYFSDSIDNTINILKKYNYMHFVGDGSVVHKEKLSQTFEKASFGIGNENLVNAKSIGIAGFQNFSKSTNYHEIEPLYLRKPAVKKFTVLNRMTFEDLELIKNNLSTDFDDFWSYTILYDELKNENSTYIVSKQNNSIVGFGGIWKSVDDIHITNIVVRKDLRRAGIGSSILEKLIEISKENLIQQLTLEVRKSNICAINLYTKYNFKQLGNRKDYYNSPTEDAIIMTLKLEEN